MMQTAFELARNAFGKLVLTAANGDVVEGVASRVLAGRLHNR